MKAEPDKVEQVLQQTEDCYRLLAENVSDVNITLDLNLHYTYCSPSVHKRAKARRTPIAHERPYRAG